MSASLRSHSCPIVLVLVGLALAVLMPQRIHAEGKEPMPTNTAEFLQSLTSPSPSSQPDLLTPAPTRVATCGGITCSSSQSCYFCGSSLSCQTTGSHCCANGTTFCSPSQICVFCNVSSSCQPPGTVCCGGLPCSPPASCHSGTFCY